MSQTATAHATFSPATPRPHLEAVYEVPLQVADREVRRWMTMLLPPFIVAAICFAAAISSGILWLIGPAMFFGPGLMIFSMVYLSLTSNSNGE